MKILIDEDLDIRLRHLFPDYETYTVDYMGWKGLSNGAMLDKPVDDGFALVITGDKKMRHQQNARRRPIQIMEIAKSRLADDAYVAEIRRDVDRMLR